MHGKLAIAVFAFPVFGLFVGVISLLSYILSPKKSRRSFVLFLSVLSLAIPALIWAGEFFAMPKLMAAGFYIPISLICLGSAIELMKRHKHCNEVVSAKCVGIKAVHSYRYFTYYSPVFSYYYERKLYKNNSFVSYSKRKVKKKFEVGQTYEIHIDPQKPDQCIAKQVTPRPSVAFLIFSIIFVIGSIFITIIAK